MRPLGTKVTKDTEDTLDTQDTWDVVDTWDTWDSRDTWDRWDNHCFDPIKEAVALKNNVKELFFRA